jgi:hypothetical protein
LIKLLFKLEYNNEIRVKEESAIFLNNMIISCPRLITNYISNIISILTDIIIKYPNEQISIISLSTISKISKIESNTSHFNKIIQLTLSYIEDNNYEKKLIGVISLCNICKYTGIKIIIIK